MTGDCLENQDATDGVADSLGEALDDLVADKPLVHALGETLVQNLVVTKQAEIETLSGLEGDAARDYYLHFI